VVTYRRTLWRIGVGLGWTLGTGTVQWRRNRNRRGFRDLIPTKSLLWELLCLDRPRTTSNTNINNNNKCNNNNNNNNSVPVVPSLIFSIIIIIIIIIVALMMDLQRCTSRSDLLPTRMP
jgi:hypothetical protein